MRTKPAFTLIELLAVITLMALLAAGTAVSLRAAASRASLEELARRVITYDRGTRTYAARFHLPLVLHLDHDVIIQALHSKPPGYVNREPLRLPRGASIQMWGESGPAAVVISREGRTRTYAVRITDAAGRSIHVVFAGFTGEATVLQTSQEVDSLFMTLAATQHLETEP